MALKEKLGIGFGVVASLGLAAAAIVPPLAPVPIMGVLPTAIAAAAPWASGIATAISGAGSALFSAAPWLSGAVGPGLIAFAAASPLITIAAVAATAFLGYQLFKTIGNALGSTIDESSTLNAASAAGRAQDDTGKSNAVSTSKGMGAEHGVPGHSQLTQNAYQFDIPGQGNGDFRRSMMAQQETSPGNGPYR